MKKKSFAQMSTGKPNIARQHRHQKYISSLIITTSHNIQENDE